MRSIDGKAGGASRSVSICIVTYRPDLTTLEKTICSIHEAASRILASVQLLIVDNTEESILEDWIQSVVPDISVTLLKGHGNIGFGRANNLALKQIGEFHLVLNPDVETEPEALINALNFLDEHPECGLITPLVHGLDGKRQYLCKRYPTALDLALRGFAPNAIKKLFLKRLNHYQMTDIAEDTVFWDPPIISGCFMLFRGEIFKALRGFDPDYFLYFEDFDLSLRAGEITRIAFVPSIRIVHGGGNASRKGFWHIVQFVKSSIIFFRKFGVKLL